MEHVLDCRGLKCPLPALRTRRALAGLRAGDVLVVEATDPMSALDIPFLLAETGDGLLEQTREGDLRRFRIAKA